MAELKKPTGTVKKALEKYRDEVLLYKSADSSRKNQTFAVNAIIKSNAKLPSVRLANLTDSLICDYIMHRMFKDKVTWPTVSKDLQEITNMLKSASRRWKMDISPDLVKEAIAIFDLTHKSKRAAYARTRRVSAREFELITQDTSRYGRIAEFAIETAARASELSRLRVGDIDVHKRLCVIGKSKTDQSAGVKGRTIPLTSRALELFMLLSHGKAEGERLLGVTNPKSLSIGFKRICDKHGISDLHFHDLRHEGVSRFFEIHNLAIPQVSLISGHKDWRSLKRYTNLDPEKLGESLR